MNKLILGLAAALSFAAPAQAATTVLSEDFESGSGEFTLTGNAYLATGATYGPCCGTPPDTTNTFVAFGGNNEASGLATADFSTTLGLVYNVTFDYSALGSGTEPLTLTVAGQTFTFNPIANNSLVFQSGMFSFTGIGAMTNLVVTSGGVNDVDAIIDNIVVTATPEPATWAMLILGFGAVGVAIRRRRKVALSLA